MTLLTLPLPCITPSITPTGLACLSLGCDVLFTDLAPLLPFTEGNIRRNCAAVVENRTSAWNRWSQKQLEQEQEHAGPGGGSGGSCNINGNINGSGHVDATSLSASSLSRAACDSLPLWFGPRSSLPPRVIHLAAQPRELLVLCSECVFRTELHVPLAETLHALLTVHTEAQLVERDKHTHAQTEPQLEIQRGVLASAPSCQVLVSFILRETEDLLFISEVCPAHSLAAVRVPSSQLVELLEHCSWSSSADVLAANCHFYSICLQ